MYWKNDNDFGKYLRYEFVGSPKNVFLRLIFPHFVLMLFWYMGCNQLKCHRDYARVLIEYPIVFFPVILFYILLYICKPLNDYFSLRQEFLFDENNVVVKKYFKNYFDTNKDLKFSREEIQSITDLGSAGISIYLNLFNQVLIPFLKEKDHDFLMKQLNPENKIKVIRKQEG